MGDTVNVPAEKIDALREALDEYPDATLYPTAEAFNVALMDTFKRAAQAARAVVGAVETPPMRETPFERIAQDVIDATLDDTCPHPWHCGTYPCEGDV